MTKIKENDGSHNLPSSKARYTLLAKGPPLPNLHETDLPYLLYVCSASGPLKQAPPF